MVLAITAKKTVGIGITRDGVIKFCADHIFNRNQLVARNAASQRCSSQKRNRNAAIGPGIIDRVDTCSAVQTIEPKTSDQKIIASTTINDIVASIASQNIAKF